MNYLKRLVLLTLSLSSLLLAVWLLNLPAKTALLEPSSPPLYFFILEGKAIMVTNNLLKLARAIAEFEGWNYPGLSGPQKENGSPSWNNHNPGNLRASPFAIGTRNNFAVFINDEMGFQALVWDLWKKCRGETSTRLSSESTIYDLIKVYSAEPESIVLNYALFIEKRTGLKMTMKIGELLR